jgi:hypothetical protein
LYALQFLPEGAELPGEKYVPLREFLENHERRVVTLSFREIEAMIGAPLPQGARETIEWWAVTKRQRVQDYAWLSAGWSVYAADRERELVIFARE